MSRGATNCPFLTFTGCRSPPARAQVGLTAEKRRDLDHVEDLGGRIHLAHL